MLSSIQCGPEAQSVCRDSKKALWLLKALAMLVIFIASAFGITLPLIGKATKFLRSNGTLFLIAKPLAAGVILATGFVHILPDALKSLNSICLPEFPWRRFPVAGFICMLSAMATLLIDLVGTEFYERKQINQKLENAANLLQKEATKDLLAGLLENNQSHEHHADERENVHIAGVHVGHDHHQRFNPTMDEYLPSVNGQLGHRTALDADELEHVRHMVVSQVLELGIITHSVVIGVSLGVSQSPCTIRPLMAALSFHQLFEGFALGGCISQARISSFSSYSWLCFLLSQPRSALELVSLLLLVTL